MSTRPLQILQRFPAHLEPARPDKQLWAVVEALSADLDVLSSDLAGVRRAHRLKDADTLRDLMLLAGLHGLDRGMPEILFARAARVRLLAKQLVAAVVAADATTRNARAESLFQLWATTSPPPRLHLYAPPPPQGQQPDLNAAGLALAAAARDSTASSRLLEAARTRLAQICLIHSRGNASIQPMLRAIANSLDMDIDEEKNAEVLADLVASPNEMVDLGRTDGFFHSADRFIHLTYVRDRLQPAPRQLPPLTPGGPPRYEPLPYEPELLGIEENPLDTGVFAGADGPGLIGPVVHKELFPVMRRGFANERLRIAIKGMNGRTKKLQFVHRDEGKALCFAGTVPDGQTLSIDEDGKFSLGGVDVSNMAFSWYGGCFGDAANPSLRDWCFDGPNLPAGAHAAKFAQTTPPGSLNPGAVFPHAVVPLGGLGIAIGLNRFAFFVDAPSGSNPAQEVADIILSWLERQPYVFKIWIPARFQALDTPVLGEPTTAPEPVLKKLERALERFRAAGVQGQAAYQDATWADSVEVMLTPAPEE